MIAIATPVTAPPLPEAFERVFREHSEFIYRTAYRVTGNPEDAEDVLQTLFVRLLHAERPKHFERNARAYLYRAAVNLSLNVIRNRSRIILADTSDYEGPASRTASRGETEIRSRLSVALAELSPKAAEILILRHVHGYTDSEIAKLLGTSRGTIAVSLFRSRSRLRKSLRAYLGGKS